MKKDETNRGLPAEVDEELDRLLSAWARQRSLPEARAGEIRAAILFSDTGLDYEWWRGFAAYLAAVVGRAADIPNPFGFFACVNRNDPRFQPYLRLT
ncbi:MAG: hypothetical protein ACM3X6_13705 [Patescibacteria group bacterium]